MNGRLRPHNSLPFPAPELNSGEVAGGRGENLRGKATATDFMVHCLWDRENSCAPFFFRLPFPKPIKRQTLLTQYALKYNYPSGLGINRITFPFSRGRWETRVLRNLVLVAESPGQTGHGRGLEGGASVATYCIALQMLFCTSPHPVHNQTTVQCMDSSQCTITSAYHCKPI